MRLLSVRNNSNHIRNNSNHSCDDRHKRAGLHVHVHVHVHVHIHIHIHIHIHVHVHDDHGTRTVYSLGMPTKPKGCGLHIQSSTIPIGFRSR